MPLKIRLFAFALILLMLLSGVVFASDGAGGPPIGQIGGIGPGINDIIPPQLWWENAQEFIPFYDTFASGKHLIESDLGLVPFDPAAVGKFQFNLVIKDPITSIFKLAALGSRIIGNAIAPWHTDEDIWPTKPSSGSSGAPHASNLPQSPLSSSLGTPMLAPPGSEMTSSAMSSTQYAEGSVGPNGGQTGYTQVGPMYVWYLDQLHWEGQQDPAHPGVPAVPLHFANGALNKVGYGWINLPYSQTGITYSQGYADWVSSYVASNGGFNGAAAGAGPL